MLDFLNTAQSVKDLTDIQQYRPDLSEEALASYSIGEKGAQNLLDARSKLPAGKYSDLEEVLAVEGIGENKVLDIVEFIWLSAEELFKQSLFAKILGENWKVDYWRYALSPEEFQQVSESPVLLQAFAADKVQEIASKKHDSYLIGALAKELLERCYADRVESLTAELQFASWWMRFDEDNWFNFETISSVIAPFLTYNDKQPGMYINPVFYRGFMNRGTLTDGITPRDLVLTINPAEYAIAIWGIALFD